MHGKSGFSNLKEFQGSKYMDNTKQLLIKVMTWVVVIFYNDPMGCDFIDYPMRCDINGHSMNCDIMGMHIQCFEWKKNFYFIFIFFVHLQIHWMRDTPPETHLIIFSLSQTILTYLCIHKLCLNMALFGHISDWLKQQCLIALITATKSWQSVQ